MPLVLAIGAGGGLLFSPVLALVCMLALHRLFPWKPHGASSGKPTPNRAPMGKWALGLFIGAVVGAPLLWGFMGAQEVIVLCGLALLLSSVLGLMSWRSNPGKFAALASGLGLLLLVAFTSHYLTPRPPAIKAALESERVKFSFSHTEALTGGHELTLPATTRMRWFPNAGQPLSLTNDRQILTRVRLLEKHHANVFAEAACSVDGTNWESQILPLSADVTTGNLSFQNGTEVTVELLGAGIAGSNRPPSAAFGPVMERELRVNEETLVQGLDFESGEVLTLSREEFNRIANDGTKRGPNRSFGDWVEAKGVDMFFEAGEKGFGLGGSITEFKLSALPVAAWDTATEPELKEALEHAVMEHDKFSNGLLIPTDAALPLTYALRSGDKLGLLQITARLQDPNGIKLRYKLVQSTVIDQIVPSIYGRELGDLKCFDFELNRFHSPPKALADELLTAVNREQTRKEVWHRVSPALLEWLGKTGVDAVAAAYDSGAELLFIDQSHAGKVALPLKGSLGEIDPSQAPLTLVNRDLPKNVMNLTRTAYLGSPREPKNEFFPFQTREGNRGVLQVTGITDDSYRGVKIRYKLVAGVKSTAEAMDAAKVAGDLQSLEPLKELEIPLQDFPEGGGREGYRLTVAPGAGDYVLATLREYEGAEVIGENTPVKRQVARLLRTQSATHSEDVFLDVHGDDVKTRIAAGSRYRVSGFGQQVVIIGLDFGGGSGNSVGGGKQPRFVTRRFKFIDSGGDKARTFIVEFELQVIDSDEAAALAKRQGISLPDENVANWAITLSAPLETTKPEIENDPRAGGR